MPFVPLPQVAAGDGAGVSDKGGFGGAGGVSGAGTGSPFVVGGVHNPMFARFSSSVGEGEGGSHNSDPTVLNPLFSRDGSGGAASEPPSPHAVVVEGGGEATSGGGPGGAHSGSLGLYFSKRPAGAGKPGRSLLSGRAQPGKLTFRPLAVGSSSRSVVGHDDSMTQASSVSKGLAQE